MTAGTLQYVSTAVMGITIDTMDRTNKNEYADALRAIKCASPVPYFHLCLCLN